MAITREKLLHIGLKDTFAVTKDFVYFFSSNCRLAKLPLRTATSREKVNDQMGYAANQSSESMLRKNGLTTDLHISTDNNDAEPLLDTYLGMTRDDIRIETRKRSNINSNKKHTYEVAKNYGRICEKKFSTLYSDQGMSFLSVRPVIISSDGYFNVSFPIRKYNHIDDTEVIPLGHYCKWLKKNKDEFFAMVRFCFEFFDFSIYGVSDIDFYELTDCTITTESTVEMMFSLKPQYEKLFEETAA